MLVHEIETARLRLRPLTSDDVDEIHRLWIHPKVRKYLWDDEEISRKLAASVIDKSLTYFKNNGFGLWAACFCGQDAIIGFGGFWFFNHPLQLQLLYGIAPNYWGKGLATEIARAMIRYGFGEHGFDRIVASADAPNIASLRVMEKVGMTFAKRVCSDSQDVIYYNIIREAFDDKSTYKLHLVAILNDS